MWHTVKNKVGKQLAVFDSNAFCQSVQADKIHSVEVKVEGGELAAQIEQVLEEAFKAVDTLLTGRQIGQHSCVLNLTFHAYHLGKSFPVSRQTRDTDLIALA